MRKVLITEQYNYPCLSDLDSLIREATMRVSQMKHDYVERIVNRVMENRKICRAQLSREVANEQVTI